MKGKLILVSLCAVALITITAGVVGFRKVTSDEFSHRVEVAPGHWIDLGDLIPPGMDYAADRVRKNEESVVSALRKLSGGQRGLVHRARIDVDGDGRGEFGFFGELSGRVPIRKPGGPGQPPRVSYSDTDRLPSGGVLGASWGEVVMDGAGEGVVAHHGYYWKLFLPGRAVDGATPGLAEFHRGGVDRAHLEGWDNDACEELWCCYAWPTQVGVTGLRAFFTNQTGTIIATANEDGAYSGLAADAIPGFDAAYDGRYEPGSMRAGLGLATTQPTANDGRTWVHVGY